MPIKFRPVMMAGFILLLGVGGFFLTSGGQVYSESEPPPLSAITAAAPPSPTVTLAAVGDVMCHMPQVRAAWDEMRQVYDFRPAFAAVKPHLSAADITVANLETILDDSRPYRGYPRFNSPAALAKALQDAGVNIVITANNHALDQGERGVLSTLANLKDAGLLAIGTYAQEEDRAPLILTVKGFKLAFLAYTTTTNGLPLPKGKDYLVNLWQAEQAAADIAAARAEGAEFVVVSLHFGQEYQRQPSKEQEEVVQQLVTAGADLILGSHPHVVQPIVEIEKPSGDGRVLVAYSLGNFISNQKDPYTDQGLILYATLRRHPLTGRVGLASYWELPTRVLRGKEIKVVPADITES